MCWPAAAEPAAVVAVVMMVSSYVMVTVEGLTDVLVEDVVVRSAGLMSAALVLVVFVPAGGAWGLGVLWIMVTPVTTVLVVVAWEGLLSASPAPAESRRYLRARCIMLL